MIKGIGIDIVDIRRFRGLRNRKEFLDEILTRTEIANIPSGREGAIFFATVFSIKEAILKALGCGLSEGSYWHDMEITGTDRVHLSGFIRELARKKTVKKVHISNLHVTHQTVVLVLLE